MPIWYGYESGGELTFATSADSGLTSPGHLLPGRFKNGPGGVPSGGLTRQAFSDLCTAASTSSWISCSLKMSGSVSRSTMSQFRAR